MFKTMAKLLGFFEKVCLTISCFCLFVIMVTTTFDVLTRKFIDYSIPSLFEFNSEYMMVTMVFLTLSYVYVKGGHIKVELLDRWIPEVIKPVLDRLLSLLSLSLYVSIAYIGWLRAARAFRLNELSNNLAAYPLGPAYLIVTIGAGLLAIRLLQSVISPRRIEKQNDTSEKILIE